MIVSKKPQHEILNTKYKTDQICNITIALKVIIV